MKKFVAASVLVLMSVSAYAADAPTAKVAAGESSTTASSILDDIYVNYFAIFHGPAVNNLNSPYTLNRMGAPNTKPNSPTATLDLDGELTTAYMVTKDIGIGPVVPFWAGMVMGQGITMGDAGIKAFDRAAYKARNFSVYANLYFQLPTSGYSQSRNMSYGIKTTPYARYTFGRWAVGIWTEAKDYAGVTAGTMYKLYGAPYVNYQLTPKISLNLEYEHEAHHDIGMTGFNFNTYQTDICPGFVWNISSKVLVNPYLQFFTTNQASFDSTAVGAVINARIL